MWQASLQCGRMAGSGSRCRGTAPNSRCPPPVFLHMVRGKWTALSDPWPCGVINHLPRVSTFSVLLGFPPVSFVGTQHSDHLPFLVFSEIHIEPWEILFFRWVLSKQHDLTCLLPSKHLLQTFEEPSFLLLYHHVFLHCRWSAKGGKYQSVHFLVLTWIRLWQGHSTSRGSLRLAW